MAGKLMAIKIRIGQREVTNPVAKFLVALAGVVLLTVVFALLFFLILPLIWFLVLSVLLLVVILLVAAPKLVAIRTTPPQPGREDSEGQRRLDRKD